LLDRLRSREVLEQAAALLGEAEPAPTRPTGSRALFARKRAGQSSPVARTFALAHRWLERSDPMGRPALAVLARAACFAPGEPIPRHVLLAAAADTRSAESLVRLLDLGLLEPA